MDLLQLLTTYKVKNGLKYIQPIHLKDISVSRNIPLHELRATWRGNNTVCNPLRKQWKN